MFLGREAAFVCVQRLNTGRAMAGGSAAEAGI